MLFRSKAYQNKKKNKYMRVLATAAACLVVIAGLTVFMKNGNNDTQIPVQSSSNDTPDVTSSQGSYQDVYNTFKKLYVTDKTQSELESIIKKSEQETTEESVYMLSKSYSASSVLNVDDISSVVAKNQPYLMPVKLLNDGKNIYCIADNSIYFIDSNDGNLTVIKQLQSENVTPVGMFLKDSKLVVLSEITTSVDKPTIKEPEETTSTIGYQQTIFDTAQTSESALDTEPLVDDEVTETTTETSQETTSQAESSIEQAQNELGQSINGFDNTNDRTTSAQATVSEETTSEETTKVTTSVVDNSSYEKITIKTVLAQVYDVTDPASPELLSETKQDGKYISATMNGTDIYIASGYNDNKNNVIKSEKDIDKYVPSYTVNGDKNYISPENIISTENVTNTNYMVITSMDIISVSPVKNVAALLGFDTNIYFSNGNLYAYVNEYEEDSQSAIITKMTANDGILSNPQSVKVNGVIKNINCINDSNGYLKVVSSVYDSDDSTFSNGIYIFDEKLNQVGKLIGFGGETIIKSVSFEDTTVYCKTSDEEKTVIAIDCSDPSTPLVFNDTDIKGSIPMVYNLGNDEYVAVGIKTDEMQTTKGIEVSIYQNEADSNEYVQKSTNELPETITDSELDIKISSKVIFIDKDKSQIGISVSYNDGIDICNKFYMVKYSDGELKQVGQVIGYHDVIDIYKFDSSFLIGDNLYLVSTGRIVCADVNTMAQLSNVLLITPYEN